MRQIRSDPPTKGDRARIRAARASARAAAAEIAERRRLGLLRVFREEIGTTVRSVSPFLVALLGIEDREVDDVVSGISATHGWPRRPRLGDVYDWPNWSTHHLLRYYVSGVAPGGGAASLSDDCHSYGFTIYGGGWARVKVVGHSLEVAAAFDAIRFETRFGILRISLDRPLPETLATACVGVRVETVIDHAALRGRGWRITDVEEPPHALDGQVLCVATGSLAYRLPWARDEALAPQSQP